MWSHLRQIPVVSDDPIEQQKLERQVATLLMEGVRTSIRATLLAVWLVAGLLTAFVNWRWAWGPALAISALAIERWLFQRRISAQLAPGCSLQATWPFALLWRMALTGIAFGTWTHGPITSPDPLATLYALSLAVIVSAVVMTQYCLWQPAVWAITTPLMLGLAIQLLWIGQHTPGFGHAVIAAFMVILWLVLLRATQRFSHAMQLLGAALSEQLAGTHQAPLMRQMNTGVAQFSELVDEIMDLAHIDAQAVQADLMPVPLRAMLARAEAAFRPTAHERGLALWLRTPRHDAVPAVLADPALLWRVLGNLLSNALRYTPTGGVMLAVRRAHTTGGLPAWRFEVRDSGPGIAEPHRAAVFDEFYRAHDDDRTHLDKGHGLGLAVAQRMAGLMDTRVLLHPASARGRGSVFSITLPRADLTTAATAEPAQAAPSQHVMLPSGLHILVIDDDPAARLALGTLLQGWGVQATVRAGLEQAKAALPAPCLAGAPQVHGLITDHWLGQGRRSHEVLDWAQQRWPGLPVAVVSGGAGSQDIQAITQRGACFWRKPLKPDTLHAWLTQLSRL
ncbi:hypothetical protein GCM10022279_26530 [Comamonas faecalis]|uniref:histidine kinase n=1 Tax=Comamonas faecalis TaxID=1387849 RepID=A0ABP7RRM7_9BURK